MRFPLNWEARAVLRSNQRRVIHLDLNSHEFKPPSDRLRRQFTRVYPVPQGGYILELFDFISATLASTIVAGVL